MEQLYAFGVSCIEFIQDWFEDSEGFFEVVNDLSNPYYVAEVLFPVVSIVDSVFAAQLLLCVAFGGWLNAVMKWWLLEDRPYWWVRETSFYSGSRRPRLRQGRQTCETGPGCPSGHSMNTAMILLLAIMWISHVMNDRKFYVWWWKIVVYPVFGVAMVAVMVARLYVATHFPHQVLLGALLGSFLAPALCIYVSDPYIWRYGYHSDAEPWNTVLWHVFSACVTVAIAALTYFGLTACGLDPHWTVKLAFRWCENPEDIHVTSTPMFSLVQCTAYLLGWAMFVTPVVARYRHYTKNRSLIISAFSTAVVVYGLKRVQDSVCQAHAWRFYIMQFVLAAVKPLLLLRVVPAMSAWPFAAQKDKID